MRGIFDQIRMDSPENAPKMIRAILDAIDRLDTFPHRYAMPRVGATTDLQVRSMPVKRYLVRYRINEPKKAVHVLRIRHGARRRP